MSATPSTLDPHVLPEPSSPAKVSRVGYALTAVGLLLSGAALFAEAGRFAHAYLLGFVFLWSIVLGCLFFVGLQHLTGAVWSVGVRRTAEMFASIMWLVALLFIPVLIFTALYEPFGLYRWVPPADGHSVIHHKQSYLNVPFFAGRAVFYFAIWIGFAVYFVRTSLRQDRAEAGPEATVAMRRRSAPFMLLFALTATFASIDWLMSLAPEWFSTVFGVYVFSGMVVTALSVITITVLLLKRTGRYGEPSGGGSRGPGFPVRDDHLYSLGLLLFAFVCFWGYIALSQFMLIWYANMPEETIYYSKRMQDGWFYVGVLLAIVRFGIPFLALLSRSAKTDPGRLMWVSVLMIFGQVLDLYWLIMPERQGSTAMPGWADVGPLLLMAGLLAVFAARFLGRCAVLPMGDPKFEACRRYHHL